MSDPPKRDPNKKSVVYGPGYSATFQGEQALLNCINALRRKWAKIRREAHARK